jgi:salicylate hydroxylase
MSHATVKLKIIIVGGGLGGLSASISCALAGHNVVILEGAKELAEVSNSPIDL